MKRLCFLSPDVQRAEAVIRDLKGHGIDEKRIYTLAKPSMPLGDLPDAGPEDNDFLPAFERGIALGGASGLFLGLLAVALPPAGLIAGGGAVLLIGVMSASLGGLLTGMAGAAFSSSRLKVFEDDIEAGKILIMVDVPLDQVTVVNRLIRRLDPDVEIEGIEPPAQLIP